ncbi:MAG: hypothetical protein F6K42_10545 [Leptolyngbya sp. SIO1D8]|nr:hypothetical protein [Leptolyngbya sp. SIO1D8]
MELAMQLMNSAVIQNPVTAIPTQSASKSGSVKATKRRTLTAQWSKANGQLICHWVAK